MSSTSSSRARRRSSTQESSTIGPVYNHSRRISQLSSESRQSGRLSNEDLHLGSAVHTQKVEDGLGSLADELAGAWDEEEIGEDSVLGPTSPSLSKDVISIASSTAHDDLWVPRGSGLEVGVPFSVGTADAASGGSQIGLESVDSCPKAAQLDSDTGLFTSLRDLNEPKMTTLIETRLVEVEKLSDYSKLHGKPHESEDISRVIDCLKSLGGQTGIETETTRLITAHTALTMHLAHQSRALQLLSYTLVSPLTPPPTVDLLNEIIPMIVDSITMIPKPSTNALCSLALFAETSSEVIEALNHLSDSLHMYRQTTSTATRKLRSTKELVAQMRKDSSISESGIRWIEDGKWEQKLADRECASVCKDVVDNFERVCEDYRERLLAKARVAVA